MKVLTVYANPNPRSFCHAVLERFSQGLAEAGHTNEVVDLYAMKFDPVLKLRDYSNWIDETTPMETLKAMIHSSSNGIEWFIAKWWLRNKDISDVLKLVRRFRSRDVVEQQEKIARAQALAIIAPVWFVGFPAILKGWIERVFTYGFAYSLTQEGWQGEIKGRVPLFKHEKALIISTTLFNEKAYQAGLGEAMKRLIDDFGFRYPGIKNVEHVYFYSVGSVDAATRQNYLQQAYCLGTEFAS
ncbi:MAG TPA: NAD(P)H-dependent oxidoreductase [Candidatus Hodarchaeales archaeon]|nr:NAD(P)H-dependent oxidoreductase [Candidatus Hodarchaeales archaeon]